LDSQGNLKYKSIEEMTPSYIFALGGTDAIKKIFDLLNSQAHVAEDQKKKQELKRQNMIGEDLTFEADRPTLAKDK